MEPGLLTMDSYRRCPGTIEGSEEDGVVPCHDGVSVHSRLDD